MKFISISSIQKSNKELLSNDVVCVLKNNEPAFYAVSPDRMTQLLEYEKTAKTAVNHLILQAIESCSVSNIEEK
jgi:hypothetical protein